MRRWWLSLVLALGLLGIQSAVAQRNFQPSPHIFRLRISDCRFEPSLKQQTAFRVQGQPGLVTALHGVIGCQRISAVSDDIINGPKFTDLQIRQVDIERDVALLSSEALDEAGVEGLEAAAEAETEGVFFIGYPQAQSSQLPTENVRLNYVFQLRDLVPANFVERLEERGSPALDINVYYTEAHIMPGHSGAPLLTGARNVVGVANGGWDEGRTAISWVIPWRDVVLEPVERVQTRFNDLERKDPQLSLSFSTTFPDYSIRPIEVNEAPLQDASAYHVRARMRLEGRSAFRPVWGDVFLEDTYNHDTGERRLEMSGDLVSPLTGQLADKWGVYGLGTDYYLFADPPFSLCQPAPQVPAEITQIRQIFFEALKTPVAEDNPMVGALLGVEELHGIRTRHYLLDASGFNPNVGGVNVGQLVGGDVWVTERGNQLVRLDGEFLVTGYQFAPGTGPFQGRVLLSVELFDLGADLEIERPESCRELPGGNTFPQPAPDGPAAPLPLFGPQASIEAINVQHNLTRNGQNGMVIKLALNINGMQNRPAAAVAYLFSNGQALRGFAPPYMAADGSFAAHTEFTPGYPQTRYDDLEIFIPYGALNLLEGGHNLTFQVLLYDATTQTSLAVSGYYPFTVTQSLDVSGEWAGTIDYTLANGTRFVLLLTMSLSQNGSHVTGTSSVVAPDSSTAQTRVEGEVFGNSFTFRDTQIVNTNNPQGYLNGGWCLKQATLTFERGSGQWAGLAGMSGLLNSAGCQPGQIRLLRAR